MRSKVVWRNLILGVVLVLMVQAGVFAQETISISFNNGPREGDVVAETLIGNRIKRFNEVYPHIKVNPDPWQYDPQSFVVKMAGGTATDHAPLQ